MKPVTTAVIFLCFFCSAYAGEFPADLPQDCDTAAAQYSGGEQALLKLLGGVHYPAKAREEEIEGTVYVKFIITETGAIDSLQIVQSAHEILDNAVLNHLQKNMQPWIPAQCGDRKLSTEMILPVRFKLM